MIPSWHGVQHTSSTAYTEYSIHWVLHTPCTAWSQDRLSPTPQPISHLSADHVVLSSLHLHNYESTNEYSLSSRCTSLPNHRLQIDRLLVLLQPRSIMASKCISKLARSQPPSVSLKPLDYSLHVRTITASMCISNLARSWPPSASLNSLEYGLSVQLEVHSKLRGYEGLPGHDERHILRGSMNAWQQCVRIHTNCLDLRSSARVHETKSYAR